MAGLVQFDLRLRPPYLLPGFPRETGLVRNRNRLLIKVNMSSESKYRIEKDSMGEMRVPDGALYAAQTQRAVENFPISGLRFSRPMIRALGLVKLCAARVNNALGLLDQPMMEAIISAAREVCDGKLDEQFVIDIFQTGSGTSSNMNTNEVIANRVKQLSGGKLNCHPNDHVNMSQSSNDVIPTAIHIAAAVQIKELLVPNLEQLRRALGKKGSEFKDILKTGRTHLQDATPVTLGQEFGGYESQIAHGLARLERSMGAILELPLGGTAVGTGLNTHPEFARRVIAEIAKETGLKFFEAENHFEAQSAKDSLVELSGQLKTVACSLAKIANDIRWLGSGPRCGLGEINLPEVQPGSSIMPGKVNPVIAESLLMVVAQVIGNDAAVTVGGHSGGVFELNVMMPVMAHNILQSIELLASGSSNFANRCVEGITPNLKRLEALSELSTAICTSLAPKIGYDTAAKVAKEAFAAGKTVREVALEKKLLPTEELNRLLDLMAMTRPGL